MKILSLLVENVKRVEAVEIEPPADAPLLVIAGENEAGKSSVLDAIEMALGGEKRIPDAPVRRGAAKGKIVADLGDIVVERRFTAAGGTSLVVTGKDGQKRPSPQALLDGLYGKLSFDPLAFAEAKPDEQATILRAIARIDTTAVDAKRKAAADERTIVNREVKTLEAQLAGLPKPPANVGLNSLDPVDLTFVQTQLRDADAAHTKYQQCVDAVRVFESEWARADQRVADAENAVTHYRNLLEEAEERLENAHTSAALAKDAVAKARATAEAEKVKLPDRAKLQDTLAQAQNLNAEIADRKRYDDLKASLRAKEKAADALTADINNADVEKVQMLTSATFPLEGIGLDANGGVTWQGLPFEQASTAVRTRVSVAIGAALNPKLRVILVRNGNDLDRKNLALLAESAREHGLQCWVERIAGGDGQATVVIEDGSVAEVR